MILETIRIVADWLGREDLTRQYGVNDHLDSILVDDDEQPPTRVAAIYDETRDDNAARVQPGELSPAIYVTMDAPYQMEGAVPTGQFREGTVTLAIRYVREDWNTANAIRDTFYTLRAVVRSLQDLASPANAASRTRNSIAVTAINSITQLLVSETVGESAVTGAVVLELDIRDQAP